MTKTRNLVNGCVERNASEADTRTVVKHIIDDMLGWCKFEDVTGEVNIRGGFADLVLRKDGNDLAVIEVKRAGMNLSEKQMRQARDYAINEGIEWVILTNADNWRINRVQFPRNQAPEVTEVFSVKLSDTNMSLNDRVELLYLLSEEAFRKNELQDYCDRNLALSGHVLINHLLSEDVLNRLRIAIHRKSGHRVTNFEVAQALVSEVIEEAVLPANVDTILRRIRREAV